MFICIILIASSIIFIGAVGAALTVSLKKGGILLGLLNIPLFVPILIFFDSEGSKAIPSVCRCPGPPSASSTCLCCSRREVSCDIASNVFTKIGPRAPDRSRHFDQREAAARRVRALSCAMSCEM